MATTHLGNPAGRLWLALNAIVGPGVKSTDQTPVSLRRAICRYAAVEDADDAGYFAVLSELMRLPVEIRAAAAELENPSAPVETLLRPLPAVQAFFVRYAEGRQAVHKIRAEVSDGVLNDLEHTSHHLSVGRTNVADADALKDIRAAAEALIDAIRADKSMPDDVRASMLRYAHAVVQSVDEFEIRGGDQLVMAWDALAGTVVQKAQRGIGKRVWGAFLKLGAAVGVVTALAGAPEQIAAGAQYIGEMLALPATVDAPAPAPPTAGDVA